MVDGASSGLLVLRFIVKQTEQVVRRKPVSSTLLHDRCVSACLQVPTLFVTMFWSPSIMDYNVED